MAYLGRGLDKISNIEVLDNITFDGSSSYSITKGSVAFTPNSAQSCLISIDGVVQATNFTVSSSTIDFGVAIPSTSVCNFFLHYGTGVMTVPSDGSVTTAKLGSNAVSSAKMFSGFENGITMIDNFRLTTAFTGNAEPIASNWERADSTIDLGKLGTGMTESSGTFSFPQTGIYYVIFMASYNLNSNSRFSATQIHTTLNNSTFTQTALIYTHISNNTSSTTYASADTSQIMNITDIANQKVQFWVGHHDTNTTTGGNTNRDDTFVRFIRLGDAQ